LALLGILFICGIVTVTIFATAKVYNEHEKTTTTPTSTSTGSKAYKFIIIFSRKLKNTISDKHYKNYDVKIRRYMDNCVPSRQNNKQFYFRQRIYSANFYLYESSN